MGHRSQDLSMNEHDEETDIKDVFNDLEELEKLVDTDEEREQVRETMHALRQTRRRPFRRLTDRFDSRDAGEALVGSFVFATEDRETIVGVTIETEASVENLDAILDVPELGFVFIGPLDLSVSLGCPGEIDHPDVQEAVETIRSNAVDAGVPVGGLGFGIDDVNEKTTNGYQMLNLGSTTGALEQIVTSWFDAYESDRPVSE